MTMSMLRRTLAQSRCGKTLILVLLALSMSGAAGAADSTAYTLDGGSASLSGQTYTATQTDESAVLVANGGSLVLADSTISSSGGTSSADESSFHGLNAVVLATSGSTIELSDSTVSSTGQGANGVFATGTGSNVTIDDVTITATGDNAHAVMATDGGEMTVTNVDMSTAGAASGAIATDRGGGTIIVTGGTIETSGQNSPAIYSTGDIQVTDATLSASGAEAAVIEGANSILLTDSDLSASFADKWGVMIYQSMSGDAQGAEGVFTMTGGSLSYTSDTGPLFFVNNTTGTIVLEEVEVSVSSGVLVNAAAGQWGNAGTNGGHVALTADEQTMTGDLVADKISSIDLTLKNGSTLTGAVDPTGVAGEIAITIDATSSWVVTADSYITTLTDADGVSGTTIANITGNGFDVYYDAGAVGNEWLAGATYDLTDGGQLIPR